MNNPHPLVSVVISVYNDSGYIRDSLISIIEQTYSRLEIIVINDGSDEKTTGILDGIKKSDSRIKLLHQDNHGLAYSLNRGIKEAEGEFIVRMDSDDISKRERINRQVEFLMNNKDVVAVGANAEVIDKDGNHVYGTKKPLSWNEIQKKLPKSPFIHPSVVFRKKEAIEVGLYPNVPMSQDLFFFNKLVKKGIFINLKEPLLQYRIHPKSLSRKSRKVKKIVFQLLNQYLLFKKLDKDLLERLKNELNVEKEKREYFYHLFLAKKYLWNNYKPHKSRENLKKAIELQKNIIFFEPIFLYGVTWLGETMVKNLYRTFKG